MTKKLKQSDKQYREPFKDKAEALSEDLMAKLEISKKLWKKVDSEGTISKPEDLSITCDGNNYILKVDEKESPVLESDLFSETPKPQKQNPTSQPLKKKKFLSRFREQKMNFI